MTKLEQDTVEVLELCKLYLHKMVADGIDTAIPPSNVIRVVNNLVDAIRHNDNKSL